MSDDFWGGVMLTIVALFVIAAAVGITGGFTEGSIAAHCKTFGAVRLNGILYTCAEKK